MKNNFTNAILTIFFILSIVSCQKNEEARKPVSRKTGTFLKESKERNAKILAMEMKEIQNIISKDTVNKFVSSTYGFYYCIDSTLTVGTEKATKGMVAQYTASVYELNGTQIYDEIDFSIKNYKVEKQDLMIGLRHGIQLMRKGDKAIFYFPSQVAFGYHGDKNKIGINVPLKYEVTLLDLVPEK